MSTVNRLSSISLGAGLALVLSCGIGCIDADSSLDPDDDADSADSEDVDSAASELVSQNKASVFKHFSPSADAYVTSASPGANFGSATTLSVDKDAGPGETRALLKFTVPAGTRVGSATLLLKTTNETADAPKVFSAGNGWNEGGVTWNNKPALQGSSLNDLGAIDPGQVLQYDVSWAFDPDTPLAADTSFTFVLVADSIDGFGFNSREAGSGKPDLVITTVESGSGTFNGFNFKRQGSVAAAYPGRGMKSFKTPATSGKFEIVAFGASSGGDSGSEVDTYLDKTKMENQGFTALAVEGEKDKKIELWARTNSGQTTINPPEKARSYSVLVLDNPKSLSSKGTVNSSGSSWKVPSGGNSNRLQVLAYFGDDPVEVTSWGVGKEVYDTWGFGDGDSLNMAFFTPGQALPSTLSISNHGPQGTQYVGIRATF